MRLLPLTGNARVLLRIAFALCVIAGTLAATQAPAAACSCAAQPAEAMLESYDGAFIGSLLGRTPALDETNAFENVVYTFEVTEWIKGDRTPGPFDVRSAGNGAACGFEVQPGQEVAVYVTVNGDVATGGLCSTASAASLLGTVKTPIVSDGPGVYVTAGWRQPARLLAADGGLVAVQPDAPAGVDGGHRELCDEAVMAEVRRSELVLVDLTSLEDLEQIPFNRQTHQLLCSGEQLFAVAGPEDAQRVYDARTEQALSPPLARYMPVGLFDDTLIYLAQADDQHPQGWRALDLASGDERFIVAMLDGSSDERIESVDFSPDGATIALSLAEGNQAELEIALVHIADGSLLSRTVASHVAMVTWLDDEQLLVRTNSGGYPNTDSAFIASRVDLTTITEFDSELHWPTHLEGDTLIGLEANRLLAMPLAGGPVVALANVPDAYQLLRLPEPVDVAPDARPIDEEPRWTLPIPSPAVEALPVGTVFMADEAPSDDGDAEPDDAPASEPEPHDELADTEVSEDAEQTTATPLAAGDEPVANGASGGATIAAIVLASLVLAGVGTALYARRRSS